MPPVRGALAGAGRAAQGLFRPYVYRGGQPVDGPGRCQCGCGELAPIATKTDRRWGTIKGQPKRYVRGHSTQKAA